MSIINVNLYGDGSRNSRLRAEYIHCDHANECSAYQEGKCFCVTVLLGVQCGIGRISVVHGGTKQSKMYAKVEKEARSHESYHKLRYPNEVYVTKIGGKAFLSIPFTWIEELPDGRLKVLDPHIKTNRLLIDAERLTPANIKAICDARPRVIMGGVISDYQEKVVPMFLHQLSRVFPEKFTAFLDAYPDYEVKPPDWRGRWAMLSTCKRGMEYKDTMRNVFRFDGEYLVCEDHKSSFNPFGADSVYVRIRVNNSMKVKITDNEQVTGETIFV